MGLGKLTDYEREMVEGPKGAIFVPEDYYPHSMAQNSVTGTVKHAKGSGKCSLCLRSSSPGNHLYGKGTSIFGQLALEANPNPSNFLMKH